MRVNDFKGVIDTTFREGQQSPLLFDSRKYRFNLNDKKTIIKALIKLGVRNFEFFSPIVNTREEDEFRELKQYSESLVDDKLLFIAHCRCNENDIKKSLDIGFNGLNLYMSISNIAQKYNYNKSYRELKRIITNTIRDTKREFSDIYLRFSTEDAFRTDIDNIFDIYDEVSEYVDTLGMPDTVGIATPDIVEKRVRYLKERYPNNSIEGHFHNDRGFSLINALTAVENGMDFVDTSVWGMGERSGITSLTGLLLNLYLHDKELVKDYNLELCYPLNIEMGVILKMQVPYNESVSLTNRTHIAGVHQKAVILNNQSYEGINLNDFGVNRNKILLGPLSGWHAIYYYLNEILDYEVNEFIAREVSKIFKVKISKDFSDSVDVLDELARKMNLRKRIVPEDENSRRIENLI